MFLLTNIFCSSQKVLIPKNGTIVFKKKNVINNKEAYIKSLDNLENDITKAFSMVLDISKDSLSEITPDAQTQETDALIVNDTISIINYLSIDNNIVKIYNKQSNEKEPQSTKVFDLNKGIFHFDYSWQISTEKYEINDNLKFENITILSYEELPMDRKVINGYNCFKIKMSYKDKIDDADEMEKEMVQLFGDVISYREMYVTDKIKFTFHPIVNQREILEKYYPLQITDHSSLFDGGYIEYTLKEFTLN